MQNGKYRGFVAPIEDPEQCFVIGVYESLHLTGMRVRPWFANRADGA